jgi:hypothetical protein
MSDISTHQVYVDDSMNSSNNPSTAAAPAAMPIAAAASIDITMDIGLGAAAKTTATSRLTGCICNWPECRQLQLFFSNLKQQQQQRRQQPRRCVGIIDNEGNSTNNPHQKAEEEEENDLMAHGILLGGAPIQIDLDTTGLAFMDLMKLEKFRNVVRKSLDMGNIETLVQKCSSSSSNNFSIRNAPVARHHYSRAQLQCIDVVSALVSKAVYEERVYTFDPSHAFDKRCGAGFWFVGPNVPRQPLLQMKMALEVLVAMKKKDKKHKEERKKMNDNNNDNKNNNNNNSISFKDIMIRKQLAQKLGGVSLRALDLIVLTNKQCRRCGYPAVELNHGLCVCCGHSWYPQQGAPRFALNVRGMERKSRRGYLLLGPEYSRLHNVRSHAVCDCDNELCIGIGYTKSLFSFPCIKKGETSSSSSRLDQWFEALGDDLSEEKKFKIRARPQKYALAHWHFHPHHFQEQAVAPIDSQSSDAATTTTTTTNSSSSSRRLQFVESESYTDHNGRIWNIPNRPPPNASLETYVKTAEATKKAHGTWAPTRELPSWIHTMRFIETATERSYYDTKKRLNDEAAASAVVPPAAKKQKVASSNDRKEVEDDDDTAAAGARDIEQQQEQAIQKPSTAAAAVKKKQKTPSKKKAASADENDTSIATKKKQETLTIKKAAPIDNDASNKQTSPSKKKLTSVDRGTSVAAKKKEDALSKKKSAAAPASIDDIDASIAVLDDDHKPRCSRLTRSTKQTTLEQEEISALKTCLAQRDEQIAILQSAHDKLDTKLEQCRTEKDTLRVELAGKSAEIERLHDMIHDSHMTLEMLRSL